MSAATLLARTDMLNLNSAVQDQLTRRGMAFNTVDKADVPSEAQRGELLPALEGGVRPAGLVGTRKIRE